MIHLNFPSTGSLEKWASTWEGFLDGDQSFPYVMKEGLYYYFALGTLQIVKDRKFPIPSKNYVLVMTSTKNLGEKNA